MELLLLELYPWITQTSDIKHAAPHYCFYLNWQDDAVLLASQDVFFFFF